MSLPLHPSGCSCVAVCLPTVGSTVKALYGHQEGATLGCNPKKPGRPSHVYHSYFVANLRIRLGVEVRPGKEHSAAIGMPGLWQTLEGLPSTQWPTFARADCAYGNKAVMNEFEERELPYLFKLRHSPRVKQLVRELLQQREGWEAAEAKLRLKSWSKERRIILVREAPAVAPVGASARRQRDPFAMSGTQSAQ